MEFEYLQDLNRAELVALFEDAVLGLDDDLYDAVKEELIRRLGR